MRTGVLVTVLLSIGLSLAQDSDPISIQRDPSTSDSDSSNPLGIIGIATLWPQGALQGRQGLQNLI